MNSKSCTTTLLVLVAVFLLNACQLMPEKETSSPTMPSIGKALESSASSPQAPSVEPPPEVQRALLPPASATLGKIKPKVQTFDISVNAVPARQFFMSLVDGTADNMIVHPEVSGTLTDLARKKSLGRVDGTSVTFDFSPGVDGAFTALYVIR